MCESCFYAEMFIKSYRNDVKHYYNMIEEAIKEHDTKDEFELGIDVIPLSFIESEKVKTALEEHGFIKIRMEQSLYYINGESYPMITVIGKYQGNKEVEEVEEYKND